MGVEMVTTTGDIVRLGGKHLDAGGLDLLGLITGSEGTLGMVTGSDFAHSVLARRCAANPLWL